MTSSSSAMCGAPSNIAGRAASWQGLRILGVSATFLLTREQNPRYLHGRIDKAFLHAQVTDFSQPFYICGPDDMVKELADTLAGLGAAPEALVIEK